MYLSVLTTVIFKYGQWLRYYNQLDTNRWDSIIDVLKCETVMCTVLHAYCYSKQAVQLLRIDPSPSLEVDLDRDWSNNGGRRMDCREGSLRLLAAVVRGAASRHQLRGPAGVEFVCRVPLAWCLKGAAIHHLVVLRECQLRGDQRPEHPLHQGLVRRAAAPCVLGALLPASPRRPRQHHRLPV